jgi:hypothetical protein
MEKVKHCGYHTSITRCFCKPWNLTYCYMSRWEDCGAYKLAHEAAAHPEYILWVDLLTCCSHCHTGMSLMSHLLWSVQLCTQTGTVHWLSLAIHKVLETNNQNITVCSVVVHTLFWRWMVTTNNDRWNSNMYSSFHPYKQWRQNQFAKLSIVIKRNKK